MSGGRGVAMDLHVDIVALHLRETFTTSHGSSDVRKNVIVRCGDDRGRVGFGEAAPYYGDVADALAEALGEFTRDPAALGSLAAHVSAWIERRDASRFESPALPGPARSALESALLDLEGQRRGCSVAALLGGDPAARVETSFTLGRAEPEEMAARARRASAWRLLKVKVGGRDDEACLAAVRAAAPAVRIRADANGGWSADEALERVRMLAAHGVELIEQPIAPGDVDAIARLAEQSPIPIWVDESVRSAADVALHARAATGVVLKLGKCGGIQGTLACVAAARAAELSVMIGCMVESSVGITAGAHVATLCGLADLDGNLLLRNDPYQGVQVEDGHLVLPNRPGLGVRVRDSAA